MWVMDSPCVGEREGERGWLHSSYLLHFITLSLSKRERGIKKFFILISPFSKGRYRGICFFPSLPSVEEREGERGQLRSSYLLHTFTLTLCPSPIKRAKE